MALDELSRYNLLQSLHFRNIQEFLERHDMYSDGAIYHLLKMNHILEIKGECWVSDIRDTFRKPEQVEKKLNIGLYFLRHRRLIRFVGSDTILGRKIELTNKGQYMIEQYHTWLNEAEKKWHYEMKKHHKEAKELREKKAEKKASKLKNKT